jgi:hypothetical protein
MVPEEAGSGDQVQMILQDDVGELVLWSGILTAPLTHARRDTVRRP